MPAPDLPPPPDHAVTERPLYVHLHAKLVDPGALAGGVVIVIDALRASVTMTAALARGAERVIPVLTVDDAKLARERLIGEGVPRERILMGGERGGVMIPGFDLDNSPRAYTPEMVRGRTVVFTSTNGTAALLLASRAGQVLVGSFANLSAVCKAVEREPRPVHVLACGTRDEISLDDVLPAGAMADLLQRAGRQMPAEDSGRVAIHAYRGALASPSGLVEAMRQSRGGRNLARLGLGDDVDFCSRLDTMGVVPRFDARTGALTADGDPE